MSCDGKEKFLEHTMLKEVRKECKWEVPRQRRFSDCFWVFPVPHHCSVWVKIHLFKNLPI